MVKSRKVKNIFQSTPSVGRATHVILKMGSHTKISIHALRGEGDDQKSKEAIKTNISIHALRGEGDQMVDKQIDFGEISIHALRGEGDLRCARQRFAEEYFNPRPPWGGRRL